MSESEWAATATCLRAAEDSTVPGRCGEGEVTDARRG